MALRSIPLEDILDQLADHPISIEQILRGLSPAQLRIPASDDEWSAVGILAHLRACADVWGDYIVRIVNEEGLTIKAMNPRLWIRRTDYFDLEFADSFAAYQAQRAALLTLLGRLSEAEWSHAATITGGGAPRRRTVLDYARWLAEHERTHLRQFKHLVKVSTI